MLKKYCNFNATENTHAKRKNNEIKSNIQSITKQI